MCPTPEKLSILPQLKKYRTFQQRNCVFAVLLDKSTILQEIRHHADCLLISLIWSLQGVNYRLRMYESKGTS